MSQLEENISVVKRNLLQSEYEKIKQLWTIEDAKATLYGNWVYFTTRCSFSKLERCYELVTKVLISNVAESYVNMVDVNMDDFLRIWNFENTFKQSLQTYRDLESILASVVTEDDIRTLFRTDLLEAYADSYRQQHGFVTQNSGKPSLQSQELSFLIYFGNTLAKKLYKNNLPLYNKLQREESALVNKRLSSADNIGRICTILYAYNKSCRVIIGVDEATDFTPMDLAAIESLGHPEYSCITLSGDQMQAFNENGITKWEQLNDGVFTVSNEVMSLKISYRQTPALLEMAKKVYKRSLGVDAPYRCHVTKCANEAFPLLYKSDDYQEKVKWIAQKITAIQQQLGYLPATAIFYPSERKGEIETFVEDIQNELNFDVSSCYDSKKTLIVVYPISLVKGFEFETAFFFDLDRQKDEHLQEQYLYVGLSRATFYLGATAGTEWNVPLSNDFAMDESIANWPSIV